MSKRALGSVLLAAAVGLVLVGSRGLVADAPEVRRLELTASRYAFAPGRIEVRQGDVVELVLRSADTEHGLAISAYKVKVAIPKGGEAVGVSFVAGRAGTFPIECSEYCGSGHKRMRGELVVAEASR